MLSMLVQKTEFLLNINFKAPSAAPNRPHCRGCRARTACPGRRSSSASSQRGDGRHCASAQRALGSDHPPGSSCTGYPDRDLPQDRDEGDELGEIVDERFYEIDAFLHEQQAVLGDTLIGVV